MQKVTLTYIVNTCHTFLKCSHYICQTIWCSVDGVIGVDMWRLAFGISFSFKVHVWQWAPCGEVLKYSLGNNGAGVCGSCMVGVVAFPQQPCEDDCLLNGKMLLSSSLVSNLSPIEWNCEKKHWITLRSIHNVKYMNSNQTLKIKPLYCHVKINGLHTTHIAVDNPTRKPTMTSAGWCLWSRMRPSPHNSAKNSIPNCRKTFSTLEKLICKRLSM